MGRLLSPNETKFWLMDYSSPMNSVVVLRSPRPPDVDALRRPGAFRLPGIAVDGNSRPRWTDPADGGEVAEIRDADESAWLGVAEKLAHVRVGTQGNPPWHAVVIHHAGGSDLVFAAHHSLTDYRTGLWVAHCFLEGKPPGPLAPACEELLPASAFGAADAEELLEQWWLARAGTRWHAIGLPRLAAVLPPACETQLRAIDFNEEETAAFHERCQREGATLNGAVAIALRDAVGARRVAHSIDLSRFIKPEPDDGPGIAISHVYTEVADGEFWESARDVRARLFEQVAAGAAADELLVLPRALLKTSPDFAAPIAEVTITGAPTVSRRAADYAGYSMQLVVGSPRAGGNVVILSQAQGRLGLISSCPAGTPGLPLEEVATRLRRAAA